MGIYLGNLKLEDIIKEEYLDKIKQFFDNNRFKYVSKCNEVEDEVGNYHIYEMPRQIMFCGKDKIEEFFRFLEIEQLLYKAFIGDVSASHVDHRDN